MSENEEQQHSEVTSPTMAETTEESSPEQKHSQDLDPSIAKKFPTMSIKSITIWPPTQRTRDAVINRLIETLSAPSILSKRYGSLSHDDASSAARAIEEEAFATASASETVSRSELSIDDDGIEILQIYSKEISKRMLETVKAKAAAAAAPPVAAAAPGTSEDVSPGESETS
ncbi:hypothetical protein Scep_001045 [Stephania cephalantha]|uniref:WPP domain-containing protein n=1 Tax=Stephania cephalantha TaxID=152367 RepID=A0AAP0LBB3_9MAGN